MSKVTCVPAVEPARAGDGSAVEKKDERALPALERILADSRKDARTFVTEWTTPGGGE